MNPNVNCGLSDNDICQHRLSNCNKCAAGGDADYGGGCADVGSGRVYGKPLDPPLNCPVNLNCSEKTVY